MIKRADFNFVWIFAILAGTAILVLMIYSAIKMGKSVTYYQDTDLAKQISVFLDPFQAGFTSSSKGTIYSKKEIVFDSYCDSTNFGYQTLSAKQARNLNEEFNVLGEEIKIKNKYVYFSKEPSKKFYVFSVPIKMAFKITDVLIVDSREFCFLDGYEQIKEFENTISVLGDKAKFDEKNCTEDSIRVCFNNKNKCDINIVGNCKDSLCRDPYETGIVLKEGHSFDYAGNLLYLAIFADKENYECNLKRIFYKAGILSLIYTEKIERMNARQCDIDLSEDLIYLSKAFFNADEKSIKDLYLKSKFLKEMEERGQCKVWSD